MNSLRSAVAVAAGLSVIVLLCVLTDRALVALRLLPAADAHQAYRLAFLGTVVFYCTVYTLIGGYVTARLAPTRPVAHAVVLGLAGMALSTLGTLQGWQIGDGWNAITVVAEGIPVCWLGGLVWTQLLRRDQNEPFAFD